MMQSQVSPIFRPPKRTIIFYNGVNWIMKLPIKCDLSKLEPWLKNPQINFPQHLLIVNFLQSLFVQEVDLYNSHRVLFGSNGFPLILSELGSLSKTEMVVAGAKHLSSGDEVKNFLLNYGGKTDFTLGGEIKHGKINMFKFSHVIYKVIIEFQDANFTFFSKNLNDVTVLSNKNKLLNSKLLFNVLLNIYNTVPLIKLVQNELSSLRQTIDECFSNKLICTANYNFSQISKNTKIHYQRYKSLRYFSSLTIGDIHRNENDIIIASTEKYIYPGNQERFFICKSGKNSVTIYQIPNENLIDYFLFFHALQITVNNILGNGIFQK